MSDRSPNLSCSPMIEGEKMWIMTSGGEVICLDIGPLLRDEGEPKEVWRYDLLDELGVFMHGSVMGYPTSRSVGSPCQTWIYVITGNGPDWTHQNIPSPFSPALVCLNKETGELVWEALVPAADILHTLLTSPLVVEWKGEGRVVASLGDGKLRCYGAAKGELLWTVDCNPAEYRAARYPGVNGPSEVVAIPVFHKGRVYVAIGQDPEEGEGGGNLVCVDIDTGKPVWANQDLNRSMSQVAVVDERVYLPDFSGFLHCLDANTGELKWRFEAKAHIWSSPLVVDGRLYIGTEDGDLMIFDLKEIEKALETAEGPLFPKAETIFRNLRDSMGIRSGNRTVAEIPVQPPGSNEREGRLVQKMSVPGPVYGSCVFANGILYVNASWHLFAIARTGQDKSETSLTEGGREKLPDALFVATPQDVVAGMLELAAVKKSDRVYDLGSGDGRIVRTAAEKYGAESVGYEIDPKLVEESLELVRKAQLEALVRIEKQDLFTVDLSEADVVTLYLPSFLMAKLLPQLQELKAGARIVSHEFKFPGIEPDKSVRIHSEETGSGHAIHLWTLPLKIKQP